MADPLRAPEADRGDREAVDVDMAGNPDAEVTELLAVLLGNPPTFADRARVASKMNRMAYTLRAQAARVAALEQELEKTREGLKEAEDYSDVLQGEVDALSEWKRSVLEALACDGDRGPLSAGVVLPRIANLLAARAAAERGEGDAERYRWLRQRLYAGIDGTVDMSPLPSPVRLSDLPTDDEIDAAVDATIAGRAGSRAPTEGDRDA